MSLEASNRGLLTPGRTENTYRKCSGVFPGRQPFTGLCDLGHLQTWVIDKAELFMVVCDCEPST